MHFSGYDWFIFMCSEVWISAQRLVIPIGSCGFLQYFQPNARYYHKKTPLLSCSTLLPLQYSHIILSLFLMKAVNLKKCYETLQDTIKSSTNFMIGWVINDSKLVHTKQIQIHGDLLVHFNMLWPRLVLHRQKKENFSHIYLSLLISCRLQVVMFPS
jgi:hypothetical protein